MYKILPSSSADFNPSSDSVICGNTGFIVVIHFKLLSYILSSILRNALIKQFPTTCATSISCC